MTKTTITREQAVAALDTLKVALKVFEQSLIEFKAIYDPSTVEVTGIIDDLEETIFEIESDIDETFEDEDDEQLQIIVDINTRKCYNILVMRNIQIILSELNMTRTELMETLSPFIIFIIFTISAIIDNF